MKRKTAAQIWFRSLLVLPSLNFRRMQNIGFTYALLPLIVAKGRTADERAALLKRHLRYFSTNNNLLPAVLGVVARVEEDSSAAGGDDRAAQLRDTLAGPFAAVGDGFFWRGLRPLASAAAAMTTLVGLVAGPFLFILIYTPFQVWLRLRGFVEGYGGADRAFAFIKGLDLTGKSPYLQYAALVIAGTALAWWSRGLVGPGGLDLRTVTTGALVWAAVVVFFAALKRKIPAEILLYGTAAVFYLVSL
ncbi:MAG TPA: PTS system mannose/fructose/sorbose family transporter subunit IID [Syntrophales bacterium]|nr:PTS system mannose/fructose/sorbose family transporter subunit IID [Syntrophales bacterium]HOM07746.1 PTS system mannose/fructose/sorbose family transporter subunit IID [Syntrophales bacterium]HOO00409.1 PTS system mannose/fructose/sorbose family transporter subunit IID [Syntrophales bacterium]HPC01756.1 PTS system mannose/fructose/sorbose family transporter subunit IID [Syntrophales bacterium]HPQ07269.1 PTS system mannose/fructose/sorbose family transporter subunit IID [Syntrophales bacteri